MQPFPHGIARAWSFPPIPAIALALTAWIYSRGWIRARRTRQKELPAATLLSFLLGLTSLWIALASPLDALDDYLLTAHMLQHFILMSIAPPLLVLGAPAVPILRGLPRWTIRAVIGPLLRRRWFARLSHTIGHPAVGWLSMNIAYLGWHTPAAFELTLRSETWHSFEHLCFLFTSILFWWVIISPWPAVPRWPSWALIPYLFTADLVNTILSAFLAFSGRVLYPSYAHAERIVSLTPLQDQVAAGSEMWILNSIVFLIPAVILVIRILSPRHLLHHAPQIEKRQRLSR